jgi:hypothetical protein
MDTGMRRTCIVCGTTLTRSARSRLLIAGAWWGERTKGLVTPMGSLSTGAFIPATPPQRKSFGASGGSSYQQTRAQRLRDDDIEASNHQPH